MAGNRHSGYNSVARAPSLEVYVDGDQTFRSLNQNLMAATIFILFASQMRHRKYCGVMNTIYLFDVGLHRTLQLLDAPRIFCALWERQTDRVMGDDPILEVEGIGNSARGCTRHPHLP